MAIDDKIRNAAEQAVGKVKEVVGDLTDNQRLEAEGRADVAAGKAKQAGEHVKDAAANAADDVRDAAHDAAEGVKGAVHKAADAVKDATN
ncbi:CsbD family protein [Propioniciclava tarda]|uniref:CsbD family protein n=1 Tax=Propioniciclava tarda TaxID=433330 RepID=A0A4Q9KP68_PROTD|nr:CsbD family protein [Propioniciclava tarda]TBT96378.1 CsbD family protein [Propioniciclava tarda]SMO36755.1 Uncharacterized conserved protein YjbJ, UPF0337 family [Propioniciclava tarda]